MEKIITIVVLILKVLLVVVPPIFVIHGVRNLYEAHKEQWADLWVTSFFETMIAGATTVLVLSSTNFLFGVDIWEKIFLKLAAGMF